MHNLGFLLNYLPSFFWAFLIWTLSTTSNLPNVEIKFISPDKIGHLFFYSIQTLLLFRDYLKKNSEIKKPFLILFLSLVSMYGVLLEFIQATIPGRKFDYADMIANFVGVFVGYLIFKYSNKRIERRS